jgi:hypothetical protein
MKRLLVLCLLLLPSLATAEVYNLAWDYPASPSPIPDGFKTYCGDTSGNYSTTPLGAVGSTARAMQVTTPAGSTKWCVLRAFDAYGESANSNEIKLAVPPKPPTPTNFRGTMQPTTP